jgi:hypothetical protein
VLEVPLDLSQGGPSFAGRQHWSERRAPAQDLTPFEVEDGLGDSLDGPFHEHSSPLFQPRTRRNLFRACQPPIDECDARSTARGFDPQLVEGYAVEVEMADVCLEASWGRHKLLLHLLCAPLDHNARLLDQAVALDRP